MTTLPFAAVHFFQRDFFSTLWFLSLPWWEWIQNGVSSPFLHFWCRNVRCVNVWSEAEGKMCFSKFKSSVTTIIFMWISWITRVFHCSCFIICYSFVCYVIFLPCSQSWRQRCSLNKDTSLFFNLPSYKLLTRHGWIQDISSGNNKPLPVMSR